MKKFVSIIVLLSMLVLTACAGNRNVADTTEHEKNDDTTVAEAPDTTETEKKPDPAPVQGGENYNVVYESSDAIEDIRPVYDRIYGDLCSFGISYLYEKGNRTAIIDYSGEVVTDISSCIGKGYGDMDFCRICGKITNSESYVDPITMKLINEPSGHGGYSPKLYYDETSGEIFTFNIGPEYRTDVEFAVVTLAKRRAPEQYETEWLNMTYGYDLMNECNGIVVDGKLVVPCEYEAAVSYGGNVCALRKDGKWGYFNKEGKQILDFEYDPANVKSGEIMIPYQASYGYIALCKDGKWAYAKTDGELVTDFEFEEARPVYDNRAWVKKDGKWCVISFTCDNPCFTPVSEAEAESIVKDIYDITYYDTVTVTNRHKKVSFYGAEGYLFTVEQVKGDSTITTDCVVLPNGVWVHLDD